MYPERWSAVLAHYPHLQDGEWDLDAPNKRLDRFLGSSNIPYLDLLPVFRSASAAPNTSPLHFRHDGHWTPAGHRLVAETTVDFVRSLAVGAP